MKAIRIAPESRITISLVTFMVTAGLMIGCFLLVSAREEKLRAQINNAANLEIAQISGAPSEIAQGTFVTRSGSKDGHPVLKIHWQSKFSAFGESLAWIIIFGIPASVATMILFGFSYLRAAVILPLHQENEALKIQVAANRDMQMFAHDIRKPFSAVKAVVQILRQSNATSDALKIAQRMMPEIDSILLHVDQMIADVLQKDAPKEEPALISLDRVLIDAVIESERKHPTAQHAIHWQILHSRKLSLTEKDLVRAIANLLCNAIEAMKPDNCITIISRDTIHHDLSAVEISIRNTGPAIPADIRNKLFTPFMTAGKKDGTGLGLAFVKKVVDDAGGIVTVTSDSSGTVFTLTFPAAPALDKLQVALPNQFNAGRIQKKIAPAKTINILVVEDNDIYFEALVVAAKDVAGEHINILHARTVAEGTRMLADQPDILICDIDLGEEDNGLTVIRAALTQKIKPDVYVHSNAVLSSEEKKFIGIHTNGFLAKPVARDALAGLIAQYAHQPTTQLTKPKIAVIDDDCFVRELWSLCDDSVDVITYTSPEEFNAAIQKDKRLLESFSAIIVDYYFDDTSSYTGDMLAQELRDATSIPLILSSDVSGLPHASASIFDLVIKKDCISWKEIEERLTQNTTEFKQAI